MNIEHTISDERGPRNRYLEKCVFNKTNHTLVLIFIVKVGRYQMTLRQELSILTLPYEVADTIQF